MEVKSIFIGLLLLAASVFSANIMFSDPTPADNALLGSVPTVNVSAVSGASVSSITIYMNGQEVKSCSSDVCVFDPSVDPYPQLSNAEVNYVKFTANDDSGEQISRTFKIDLYPPEVSVAVSPSLVSGTVAIPVSVEESISGVDRIEVSAGSYTESNNGPFYYGNPSVTFYWPTSLEVDGPATIEVRAYDGVGNVGIATVDVVVNNTLPTISFVDPTPANGSEVSGQVTFNITASGNDVATVTLHIGTVASITLSAPYEYVWDTTTFGEGPYEVYAEVNDTNGDVARTETRTYVVNNTGNAGNVTLNFVEPTPGPNAVVSGVVIANVTAVASGSDPVDVLNLSILNEGGSVIYMNSTTSATNLVLSWDSTSNGDGNYTLVAYAESGSESATINRTITVNNNGPQINVSFTGNTPVDGGQVTGDFTIEVNATSTAPVDGIELYVDNVNYSSCPQTSICSVNVDTSTYNAGDNISFYAVAYSGSTSNTTETRTVTFNLPSISVNITAPADGAPVQGVEPITVEASATAGLQMVRIYIDGYFEVENSSFSSSWTYQWDTTAESNSVHTIVAEAVDSDGVAVNSSEVSVTVNNSNPSVNLSIDFVAPTPADNTTIDPSNTSTIINASVTTNLTVDTIILHMNGNPVANVSGQDYLEYDWNVSNYGNGSYDFYATVNTTTGETASTPTITLNIGQANNNGGNNNNNNGGSSGGGGGSSSKKTKDKPMSISYVYLCPDSDLEVTVESDDSPVSGAVVHLRETGASFSYVEKTDSEGMAKFHIREAAQYSLNATKEGYKLAERSVSISELCETEEQETGPSTNETASSNETTEASLNQTTEEQASEEETGLANVTAEGSEKETTGELSPTTEPTGSVLGEEVENKGLVETLTENPILAFIGIVSIPFVLIALSRIAVSILRRL